MSVHVRKPSLNPVVKYVSFFGFSPTDQVPEGRAVSPSRLLQQTRGIRSRFQFWPRLRYGVDLGRSEADRRADPKLRRVYQRGALCELAAESAITDGSDADQQRFAGNGIRVGSERQFDA